MRSVVCLIFVLLASCASFRVDGNLVTEYSAPPATEGPVAEFAARTMAANSATEVQVAEFAGRTMAAQPAGESAFWLLGSSRSALEARSALFDAARETLDLQYFIWQSDASGYYLLQRMLAAADRGVRVRLIVDDLSASAHDQELYALSEHANIEARIFNPFRTRSPVLQGMEFLSRFGTLNHRMHNKAVISDGRVGIIGGRNIGDRYFGVFEKFLQHDLDIMFAGDILDSVTANFDLFWNAPRTVSVNEYLRPRHIRLGLDDLREMLMQSALDNAELLAGFDLDAAEWLRAQASTALFGPGRFLEDAADIDDASAVRMKAALYEYMETARRELVISTAYFIPDEELLTLLETAVQRGVRVILLTNSVQSNNHMLAHVAYKRSRERVLQAGIELFEFRADAQILAEETVPPTEPGFLGLHHKAIVVDRQHALVGTANLDPRALDINTETAIIIDDQALSLELRELILEATQPVNAWRLALDSRGHIVWETQAESKNNEPVRGPWQRMMQFLHVLLLPLKDQA